MDINIWERAMLEGNYISTDGRYTAELRKAGYYSEFDCKLTRHYAIRLRGQNEIVGTARTLKEAARTLAPSITATGNGTSRR